MGQECRALAGLRKEVARAVSHTTAPNEPAAAVENTGTRSDLLAAVRFLVKAALVKARDPARCACCVHVCPHVGFCSRARVVERSPGLFFCLLLVRMVEV